MADETAKWIEEGLEAVCDAMPERPSVEADLERALRLAKRARERLEKILEVTANSGYGPAFAARKQAMEALLYTGLRDGEGER